MALRVDLFSIPVGADPERLVPAEFEAAIAAGLDADGESGVAWTAWVAASDADETALSALLDELSETGSLIGVSVEGVPADALDPSAVAAAIGRVASDSRGWHGALVRGIDTVARRSMSLAWWTRFDAGGSVADPEREWATGHS